MNSVSVLSWYTLTMTPMTLSPWLTGAKNAMMFWPSKMALFIKQMPLSPFMPSVK